MSVSRVPAASGGSYSDGVSVSGGGTWISVAGQVGVAPDNGPSGSVYEQSKRCFDRIDSVLSEFGAGPGDIIRITVYVLDLAAYDEFALARAERFGGFPPASAAVQVSGLLAGADVEVSADAFLVAR